MTVIPLELTVGLSPNGFLFKILNSILGVLTSVLPTFFGYQIMLVAQSPRAKQ